MDQVIQAVACFSPNQGDGCEYMSHQLVLVPFSCSARQVMPGRGSNTSQHGSFCAEILILILMTLKVHKFETKGSL